MKFSIYDFQWTREPASFAICDGQVEIVTKPHTDLNSDNWLAHDGQEPDKA